MTMTYKRRLLLIISALVLISCSCGKTTENDNPQIITKKNETGEMNSIMNACYGTVMKVEDDKMYIKGVNSKIYIGNTDLLKDIKENDFVYFEFKDVNEVEDDLEVTFTKLCIEDRKIDHKRQPK